MAGLIPLSSRLKNLNYLLVNELSQFCGKGTVCTLLFLTVRSLPLIESQESFVINKPVDG